MQKWHIEHCSSLLSHMAELIERTCQYAHRLVTCLGVLPGAELIWEPQINQGLVRFLSAEPNATDADHDRRTDSVMANVLESGEAFFSGTTWHGKRCMRVSVCNWNTKDTDVERALSAVQIALAEQKTLSRSTFRGFVCH